MKDETNDSRPNLRAKCGDSEMTGSVAVIEQNLFSARTLILAIKEQNQRGYQGGYQGDYLNLQTIDTLLSNAQQALSEARNRSNECVGHERGGKRRCCDRAGEYNGFGSGPTVFTCPVSCSCHD